MAVKLPCHREFLSLAVSPSLSLSLCSSSSEGERERRERACPPHPGCEVLPCARRPGLVSAPHGVHGGSLINGGTICLPSQKCSVGVRSQQTLRFALGPRCTAASRHRIADYQRSVVSRLFPAVRERWCRATRLPPPTQVQYWLLPTVVFKYCLLIFFPSWCSLPLASQSGCSPPWSSSTARLHSSRKTMASKTCAHSRPPIQSIACRWHTSDVSHEAHLLNSLFPPSSGPATQTPSPGSSRPQR